MATAHVHYSHHRKGKRLPVRAGMVNYGPFISDETHLFDGIPQLEWKKKVILNFRKAFAELSNKNLMYKS